jgi:hypothetical protein
VQKAILLYKNITEKGNKMAIRKVIFLTLLIMMLSSCTTSGYDSFRTRESSFNQTQIVTSNSAFSKEMITTILETKFPPNKIVSIAILFIDKQSPYSADFSIEIMKKSNLINGVEKFVSVPSIMIPNKLTFDDIQQIGIRSLCEYTLVFYSESRTEMSFTQFIKGEIEFKSDVEFSLIDNQTTAVIASDRLVTKIMKKNKFFNDKIIEQAKNEVFNEQANILAVKLNALFSSKYQKK